MKKTLVSSILFLVTNVAQAQEVTTTVVTPFYQDKTFLMLIGGAIFLIILLIIKKVLANRAMKQSEKTEGSENL